MKRICLFAGAIAIVAATAFSGCSNDLTSADEDSMTITEQGPASGKILERGLSTDGEVLNNTDDNTTATDSTSTVGDYPAPSSTDTDSNPKGKSKR